MTSSRKRRWLIGVGCCVLWLSALAWVLLQQGCAAARDATTGEIVVGVGLARLPETGNQLIATGLAAATGLPGVGPIALGVLGIAGAAFGAKKVGEKRAEDRAWAEAQATYSPPPGMIVVPAAMMPPTKTSPPAVPAAAGATQ